MKSFWSFAMDHYSDRTGTILREIDNIKNLPDFVKCARVIEKETIPSRAFAYPEKRMYPISDPASTYLSAAYWLHKGAGLTHEENEYVKRNIFKAAEFYGVAEDILDFCKKYKESVIEKEASVDDLYAIPEQKAYPICDRTQLMLAKENFNKMHSRYEIPERVKIAQFIVKKSNEFGEPVQYMSITKYASNDFSERDSTAVNIGARALSTTDEKAKNLYLGLAKIAHEHDGNISNLMKLASIVEKIDQMANVSNMSAFDAVFNTRKEYFEKMAEETIELLGNEYNTEDLLDLPEEFWVDTLGEDFLKELMDGSSNVHKYKLMEIIPTLPLPEKQILVAHLNDRV